MHREKTYELGTLVLVIFLFISFSGCRTGGSVYVGNVPPPPVPAPAPSYDNGGPPPWAPAHGYRAKHTYRYYPNEGVYFEAKTGAYFYLSDGRWRMSVSLPSSFRITVDNFVTLEMDSDRPYEYHSDVVKKYPPGQQKKNNKSQNKGNKKGNNKGK